MLERKLQESVRVGSEFYQKSSQSKEEKIIAQSYQSQV